MKNNNKLAAAAAACAILAFTGAASAQTAVVAATDLNLRAGPGPQYEVVGLINIDGEAELLGCLEASSWCEVSYNGVQGWAYSDYLIGMTGETQVVVTERPAEWEVPVREYEVVEEEGGSGGVAGLASGATTGAIAGALIAGPLGAAVGGVAGAASGGIIGSAIDPDERAVSYVRENPADPVYLDGEVVVGAGIPEAVEVYDIPDYEYQYVYVNQQPVLVDPADRRIVYVVR